MTSLRWRVRAFAKVNLALYVGARRADGYHPVATVIQRLALYDRLEISVEKRSAPGLEIRVWADVPGVPENEENLAGKAVRLLAPELARAGYGGARVTVRIEKRIPAAAGLGGGSADAAAVLESLDQRLGLGIGREALARRAAALGSDVPACLYQEATVGTGRGERVQPVAAPVLWWVLAHPGGALRTGDVYQAYDGLRPPRPGPEAPGGEDERLRSAVEPLVRALSNSNVAEIANNLYNDLQEAACRLRPDIEPLLEAMMAQGALGAIVSGSGPTVAALAPSPAMAERIAAALSSGSAWTWWGPGLASGSGTAW